MRQRSNSVKLTRWILPVAIIAILLWTLFPLWWAIALSLKHPSDFFTPKVLPFVQFLPTLDNWRAEWQGFYDPAGLGRGLANSLFIATVTSIVSLALGGLAAFGFVLQRRGGRLVWPLLMLAIFPRVLPPVIIAIPFSMLMSWLGLRDTLLALVFAHTTLALPLAILILYTAMAELPPELLDAARVDGCGWLRTLYHIVTPLLFPAVVATGALCFVQSWNDFVFALFNVQQWAQTAPLSVVSLITKDGIEFRFVGSHLVMVMLPPLLLALAARRYIVRGLSLGTMKD